MTKHQQNEEEASIDLVTRIIGGDELAESEMIERYERGLIFMLNRRAENPELAKDVAQETWRIVIEKVRNKQINEPSKLAAFIVQTGKYQLLMSYRKADNMRILSNNDSDNSPDQSDQPQDVLEKYSTGLIVRKLLGELKTARDRDIMERFYLHEQTKQTICHELGLDDLHFNRVLYRARQRFKQLWEEYARKAP